MDDQLVVAMDVFECDSVTFNVFVFIKLVVKSTFVSHFTVDRSENSDQIVKQEDVGNIQMKYHETLMPDRIFLPNIVLVLS